MLPNTTHTTVASLKNYLPEISNGLGLKTLGVVEAEPEPH